MAPHPVLSVLIPTFGRPGYLYRTLRSLSAQVSPPGGVEVIVAIDGPDPATAETALGMTTPFRLIVVQRERNGGRAAACNSALAAARGELVLFLDDDICLEPGVLTAHVASHEETRDVACLGLAYPRPPARPNAVDMWTRKRYEALVARLVNEGRFRSPRDASTVNLSVSRRAAMDVGGFCEDFQFYGKEDVEFVYRLTKAGIELRLLPQAVLYHWFGKSLALFVRQRVQVAQNDLLLRELHPELGRFLECDSAVPSWSSRKRLFFRSLAKLLGESEGRLDIAAGLLDRLITPGSSAADTVVELAREFGYFQGVRSSRHGFDRERRGNESPVAP